MTAGKAGLAASDLPHRRPGQRHHLVRRIGRRSVTVTVGSQSMLPARAASATPQPRRTSMVWMEMPVARGTVDGPARRSTTSTRAPWRSAESAVARPAGPAPTMSTSVVNMPPRSRADRPGTSVSATYLDLGQHGADQPLHRGEVHANTFFVTATATPRSGSAPAQLPPAPAQPNARGASSSNGRPSAKPRLMRHSLPYTWSSPSADTVVTSASRGLVEPRAYRAASARAVTFAPGRDVGGEHRAGRRRARRFGSTVSGAARSISARASATSPRPTARPPARRARPVSAIP